MILNAFNDYWRGIAARYRSSPLPAFLAWWRSELAGLIPASLRRRFVPPRPSLWVVVEPGGTGMSIWRADGALEKVDDFGADDDTRLLRERWQGLLQSFRDGAPEIRLCLPESEALDCPVELPLAVESNLESALGFQLDQLTPFRVQQVLFDYRIRHRDTEHGRLNLDLRLVPVNRIEAVRERLAEIGIRPHIIDTLDGAGEPPQCDGFNLIPENDRPRYVFARARLNWILGAVAVVALVLVMAQSVYLREQKVETLRSEVAALRQDAESVLELQRQLEDSLAAANFLAEQRQSQPVIIQVLDEISSILPNDMWLQQLQVRGNELLMMGLADGSQRLIDLVNDSALLGEAEFRGAINVDPATGQERFNARATIRRREGRDAAAAGPGE